MMKVVLGTDTDTDDVIAIMLVLLSSELDVIGIRSVSGNRGIELTMKNTLRVVEYLGAAQVSVHRDCVLPMVSTLSPERRINIPYTGPEDPENNAYGDYVDLPPATIKPASGSAVSWLIDILMESEGDITLVSVGPLTNIVMAFRAEPAIAEKVRQIVLMGGECRGANIIPSAEFNFWIDPEAVKVVLNSGCDITVVPLNVTHTTAISVEDAKELRRMGVKVSVMTADIIEHRRDDYKNWQPMDDINTVSVHDALIVCMVLNPQVLSLTVSIHADINIKGGTSDGQNIFGLDRQIRRIVLNVKIALGADRTSLSKMLKEILGGNGS